MAARKQTSTSERKPAKRKPADETKKQPVVATAAKKQKKVGKKTSRGKRLSPRAKVRKSQESVLQAMPDIVDSICDVAKEGNHSAAKFVFDFARITDLQSPLEEPSKDSLASLLLEKIEGPDVAKPAPDSSSSTVE